MEKLHVVDQGGWREPERTDAYADLPMLVVSARAVGAPAAKHPTALTGIERRIAGFIAVVDVLAGHDRPMWRGDVYDGLVGVAMTRDQFDHLFDTLLANGAIHPRRTKKNQPLYELDYRSLLTQQLLITMSEDGGYARLHEMLVVAADRLEDDDLTLEEAERICRTLTATLNTFAGNLERLLDQGSSEQLVAERPGRYATRSVEKIDAVASLVPERFRELRPAGNRLWDAGARFNRALEDLIDRVVEKVPELQGGSLLALLPPSAYTNAARRAQPPDLATVAADVVFDAPVLDVDFAALRLAASELGKEPPERTVPTPPADTPTTDTIAQLAQRLIDAEAERNRRVRWAEALLDDGDTAGLHDGHDRWPAVAVRLGDAMAVARDPHVPITVDGAERHDVDPAATVAVAFPFRLRRIAPANSEPGHGGQRTEEEPTHG